MTLVPKNLASSDIIWDRVILSENPVIWLLGNMSAPLLTNSNVLALFPDLSAATLQNWANRGLLQPHVDPARKSWRRYDGQQILSICAAMPLIDIGFSPMKAFMFVNMAFLTITRDIVDDVRLEPSKDDIPLSDIESYYVVFDNSSTKGTRAVHEDDLRSVVSSLTVSAILPMGRLMKDCAVRLRAQLQETRERPALAAAEAAVV